MLSICTHNSITLSCNLKNDHTIRGRITFSSKILILFLFIKKVNFICHESKKNSIWNFFKAFFTVINAWNSCCNEETKQILKLANNKISFYFFRLLFSFNAILMTYVLLFRWFSSSFYSLSLLLSTVCLSSWLLWFIKKYKLHWRM